MEMHEEEGGELVGNREWQKEEETSGWRCTRREDNDGAEVVKGDSFVAEGR